MNLKKRVDNIKKTFGTACPFKIAKDLKIKIIFTELGSIKGYFKVAIKKKYIVINSELSEIDKRIVCAHELGHFFLHRKKDIQFSISAVLIPKKNIYEDEANEFAIRLLYDELIYFVEYTGDMNTNQNLIHIYEKVKKETRRMEWQKRL